MTTIWNDSTYTKIVERYPELETKSESVAFCTWVYSANPKASTKDLQDQAKETGLKVAGRAVGSARAIVGMQPLTKKRASTDRGQRRGPGRPRGSKNRPKPPANSARIMSTTSGVGDIVKTLQSMQDENQRLREALEQLRDFCSQALDR